MINKQTNLIALSGKMQSGKNLTANIIQYLDWQKYENAPYTSFDDFLITGAYNNPKYKTSNWQIKAFATKLKQIVSILTGIPVEDLEKQEVKDSVLGEEWNKYTKEFGLSTIRTKHQYTVRQMLQKVGTNAMRDVIHPNVWCNALFSEYPSSQVIKQLNSKTDGSYGVKQPNWCITDVRFPNELQAVKDRGGTTIRINRSRIVKYSENISYEFNPILDEEHSSETSLDSATFDYVINNDSDIPSLIQKVKEILIKEKLI